MIIYNAMIYSLSVLLLLSSRIRASKIRYILSFIGLTVLQIILGENNYFTILIAGAFLFLCFCKKKKFRYYAFQCLSSITIASTFIVMFSSLWLLISPKTKAFEWVVGALILLSAIAWKLLVFFCEKEQKTKNIMRFSMVLQIMPLLFYTFILPTIRFDDSRDLAIVCLFFISILFVANQLLNQIQRYKASIAKHQLNQERMEETQKHIDLIIEQEHSFMQIIQTLQGYINQGDMSKLQAYFELNIAPMYHYNNPMEHLKKIESELLRNIIQREVDEIMQKKNVIVAMVIRDDIHIPTNEMFNISRIIIEFFTNAKKELKQQQHASLQVHFIQNESEIMFQISNSLKEENKNYFEVVENKNGGLNMIERIVSSSPYLRHSNYISPVLFLGWRWFYQELYVSLEE